MTTRVLLISAILLAVLLFIPTFATAISYTQLNVLLSPREFWGSDSFGRIILFWEEPRNANGQVLLYRITCATSANGVKVYTTPHETGVQTYEIFDLKPFSKCTCWVQAVGKNGPGVSTHKISGQVPRSLPMKNIELKVLNSTSIIIRWGLPSKAEKRKVITGYKIQYRPKGDEGYWHSIITPANQTMYQLNGLEKDVVYQVRMCELDVYGDRSWSNDKLIKPYDEDWHRVPNPPTNVTTKAMSDSISVSWSPPQGNGPQISEYTLSWGKRLVVEQMRTLDSGQRSFTIDSLEPLTNYTIWLIATNAIGDGKPVVTSTRTPAEGEIWESVEPPASTTDLPWWDATTFSEEEEDSTLVPWSIAVSTPTQGDPPQWLYESTETTESLEGSADVTTESQSENDGTPGDVPAWQTSLDVIIAKLDNITESTSKIDALSATVGALSEQIAQLQTSNDELSKRCVLQSTTIRNLLQLVQISM